MEQHKVVDQYSVECPESVELSTIIRWQHRGQRAEPGVGTPFCGCCGEVLEVSK